MEQSNFNSKLATTARLAIALIVLLLYEVPTRADESDSNFAPSRLVAWCIVPFDAKNRSPAERSAMIKDLGMQRVAYDWRKEHVSSFEEEILQYKKHQIEFFAFWSWHDAFESLITKHKIKPQIWVMLRPPKQELPFKEQVASVSQSILPLAKKTQRLGLKLGLYNHGGWGGEPRNMVAVCEHLHQQQANHVGIVYNFHHGHEHIDDFASSLKLMKPYLHCLNLNGMAEPETVHGLNNKILPIGSGVHETKMIQEVVRQDYDGPIGILDHRNEVDAKESLQQNLAGLAEIVDQMR